MKYAWIKEDRDSFPVRMMCRVLEVSTSGFYKSLKPTASEHAKRSLRIRGQVQEIYEENHQI